MSPVQVDRQRHGALGPRSPHQRTTASGLLLTVLAIGVTTTVIVTVPRFDLASQAATSFVVLTTLVLSGTMVATSVRRGRLRPIFGAVMAFYFVWFGLAVLAQIALDRYPLIDDFHLARPDNDGGFPAAVVVAISLLAFVLGNRFSGPPKASARSYRPATAHAQLGLILLALAVTFTGIALVGGPAALFQSRQDLSVAFRQLASEDSSFSISRSLIRFPSLVAAYAFLMSRMLQQTRARPDRAVAVAGWTSVVAAFVVNNPISTPRFWSLSVYASLALLSLALARRGPTLATSLRFAPVAIVAAAMFILPYADVFRRSLDATIETRTPTELMTESGDYSAWSHTLLAVDNVQEQGIRYGAQTPGVVLFFVPRRQWEDKPVSTAIVVGRDAGLPSFLNPASPLPAEIYVDYGWLGVAAVFAFLGRAAGRIDQRFTEFLQSRRIASLGTVLVPFLVVYVIYILRGSLASSVPPLVLVSIGVRAFFRVHRERSTGGSLS